MIHFAVTLTFYSRKQQLYNAGHTDLLFPVNGVCETHTLCNQTRREISSLVTNYVKFQHVHCVKLNISSMYTALDYFVM